MSYNQNHSLKYPKGEDFYNVEDFNGNFSALADELDRVDNEMSNVNDDLNNKADLEHTHSEFDEKADISQVKDIYVSNFDSFEDCYNYIKSNGINKCTVHLTTADIPESGIVVSGYIDCLDFGGNQNSAFGSISPTWTSTDDFMITANCSIKNLLINTDSQSAQYRYIDISTARNCVLENIIVSCSGSKAVINTKGIIQGATVMGLCIKDCILGAVTLQGATSGNPTNEYIKVTNSVIGTLNISGRTGANGLLATVINNVFYDEPQVNCLRKIVYNNTVVGESTASEVSE